MGCVMISTVQFEHGGKTCAANGKPCEWVTIFGFMDQRHVCRVFNKPLVSVEGELQRCGACVERFGGGQ